MFRSRSATDDSYSSMYLNDTRVPLKAESRSYGNSRRSKGSKRRSSRSIDGDLIGYGREGRIRIHEPASLQPRPLRMSGFDGYSDVGNYGQRQVPRYPLLPRGPPMGSGLGAGLSAGYGAGINSGFGQGLGQNFGPGQMPFPRSPYMADGGLHQGLQDFHGLQGLQGLQRHQQGRPGQFSQGAEFGYPMGDDMFGADPLGGQAHRYPIGEEPLGAGGLDGLGGPGGHQMPGYCPPYESYGDPYMMGGREPGGFRPVHGDEMFGGMSSMGNPGLRFPRGLEDELLGTYGNFEMRNLRGSQRGSMRGLDRRRMQRPGMPEDPRSPSTNYRQPYVEDYESQSDMLDLMRRQEMEERIAQESQIGMHDEYMSGARHSSRASPRGLRRGGNSPTRAL